MANFTDYFVRNSDNVITLSLTENDSVISSNATEIVIKMYQGYSSQVALTITRTPDGDGVTYSAGVLEVEPSGLTETLTTLVDGRVYSVTVLIKTVLEPDGVLFGGADSDDKMFWHVSTA